MELVKKSESECERKVVELKTLPLNWLQRSPAQTVKGALAHQEKFI